MKRTAIEEATRIVTEAHAAGMLYVPPCIYTVKEGFTCTKCGETKEHKLGCEPPFGLKALPKAK